MTYEEIAKKAFDAAQVACREYLKINGDGWPCGFAWVVIKPGTSSFAKFMKKAHEASKHYYGGVCVWDPSKSGTQNMDAKMAGALAFAAVLIFDLILRISAVIWCGLSMLSD